MSEPLLVSTGIESISTCDNNEGNEQIYNLMGQAVKVTQKGVYVKKGKAFVVK